MFSLDMRKFKGSMWAKFDQDIVWESNDTKLFGVTIDHNLILRLNFCSLLLERYFLLVARAKSNEQ